MDDGTKDISEEIADLLLAKIKKLGRQILLHIISGILAFFALYFIFDLFSNIIRLGFAFLSGIIIWLPALGSIFERLNIVSDLSTGKMYFTCGIKNSGGVWTLKGVKHVPLIFSEGISDCAYILPCSRYLIPAEDKK